MWSEHIIPKLWLSFWEYTVQHSAMGACESREQETEAKTHFINSTIYPWCIQMCYSLAYYEEQNETFFLSLPLREICCCMFSLWAKHSIPQCFGRELPEQNNNTSCVICWHGGQEYAYSLDLASCLLLRHQAAGLTDNLLETHVLTLALFKSLSMVYCFVSFKPVTSLISLLLCLHPPY